jgi:DNA-binding MarR family transcriptional regulator
MSTAPSHGPGDRPSDEHVADDLRLALGRLGRRLRQQSLGDMTPSQRSVLTSLDRYGPTRMGELARIENISPPSLSGIVGRLEDRGLVMRSDDPDDARSTLVEVTPEATAALARARRERTAFLVRGLATLTDDERELLARAVPLLDRLVGVE